MYQTISKVRRVSTIGKLSLAALALGICAGCGTSGASSSAVAPTKNLTGPKAAFNQLVASARKSSDDTVALPIAGTFTNHQLSLLQSGFKKEFGINVKLDVVPGNAGIVIPTKMLLAAEAGKGVVDIENSATTTNMSAVLKAGDLQEPDWTALEEKWPILKTLRTQYGPEVYSATGKPISDFCVSMSDQPFVLAYNKKLVSPKAVKNLTWLDLEKPQWKGKVGIDSSGDTEARLTMIKGFSNAAAISYAKALVANGVVPISGSPAIVTALESGRISIGPAAIGPVVDAIQSGADLGYVIAPLSSTIKGYYYNSDGLCISKYLLNNPSVVNLYFGWFDTQGLYATATSGSAVQRLDPAEANHFPLAKEVAASGLTGYTITSSALKTLVPLQDQIKSILTG